MARRLTLPAAAGRTLLVLLTLVLAMSLAGCGGTTEEDAVAVAGENTGGRLILASTTSTQDSGLFEELIPAFEVLHPEHEVQVVAVGTGAALEMGRNGDADVLLVHARPSEEEFVEDGYGIERRDVMYNDFVIAGPPSDPAGIAGTQEAADALAVLAEAEAEFVSRGDDSGTHKKELALWEAAEVEPSGAWYLEAGQGMGDCLAMASERQAYVMVDRATYLSMLGNVELEIAVEYDPALFNQYGVIPVVGAANASGAAAFADWIVSDRAQVLIGKFAVEEYGEPLFVPNGTL